MIFLAILCCCLSILSIYLFCLGGRTEHKDLHKLCGWKYAHRGLHNATRPENSMAAFRSALTLGYGIELDVHLMKDGPLVVIHDSSLKRTAGADVKIEDLTVEDLEKVITVANKAASLTTSRHGAIPAMPTREEVFME